MLFIPIVASVLIAGSTAADAYTPLIACPRAAKPPVIDATLDDPCWQRAIWTSHFHVTGSAMPAPGTVSMAVVHSADALVVGWDIVKVGGATGKPRVKATATAPGDSLVRDDFVFMFVHPRRGENPYYEFVANVRGARTEALRTDYGWTGPWRAAGRATKTGWCAEIRIPFKTMGVATPGPGDVWGFSPGRKDPRDKRARYVCWADIGGFHDLEAYGRLVFVPPITGTRVAIHSAEQDTAYYVAPATVRCRAQGVRVPARLGGDVPFVRNPSFEQGLSGWRLRFSQRTYPKSAPVPVSAVQDVTRHGTRALCIGSANAHSVIQATHSVVGAPAGRFELSAMLRLEHPDRRDGVNLFVSSGSRRDVVGGETALESTFCDDTPVGGGWRRQSVRFRVPDGGCALKVGVEVANYVGRVWVDDVRVRRCDPKRLENDGLWFWDARIPDKHGMAPRKRLFAMMESNSPWIARAQRYNDVLGEAAFARDALGRLHRACAYYQTQPDLALDRRVGDLLAQFDKTDRTFIDLYQAKKVGDLAAKLDPLLAGLARDAKALHADLRKALAAAVAAARQRVGDWPAPPTPAPRQRYRMGADGSVNQLVFGKWGKWRYHKLGRMLDLWDHTSRVSPTHPPADADGSLDWRVVLDALKKMQAIGIRTIGLGTTIMTGSGQHCPRPPAWKKRYGKDRRLADANGRLNLWHPGVLDLHTGLARDIGTTLRAQPDILFYHYAWESSGPRSLSPRHTDPTVSSGLRCFQQYLKATHRTIAGLNKAWGGAYKSFDEITTAGLTDPKVGDAMKHDYLLWRQESYMDHTRAIYRAFKQADPDTAVLAAHSGLMSRIDPTRVFETCNVLEQHGGWRLADNLYLASTAPVEGGHLCKFENFWQYQEQSNRWGDERAQYAAVAKYLYRNALTGEVLQTWCFPYTSQAGWNWRQAQWCQTRTDYLTVRYSAAALPVAKRRVENLQQVFFLGTRRDFSDMLVVWPRTTWLRRSSLVRAAMGRLVLWLHGQGIVFEYRGEPRLASGREDLSAYKLIVLPYATFLDDGVGERLLAWVRAGGTLVTIGPAGICTKYGRHDPRLMTALVGVAPRRDTNDWDFGPKHKDTPIIRNRVGRGTVAVVTRPIEHVLEDGAVADRLAAILREAAPQPARSDGDVFEFYRRIAPDGTRYLAVLNPNPDAAVCAPVTLRGTFKRVVDVDIPGGLPAPIKTADGKTVFPLRLQPAGMTVLRLDP